MDYIEVTDKCSILRAQPQDTDLFRIPDLIFGFWDPYSCSRMRDGSVFFALFLLNALRRFIYRYLCVHTTSAYTGIREGTFPTGKVPSRRIARLRRESLGPSSTGFPYHFWFGPSMTSRGSIFTRSECHGEAFRVSTRCCSDRDP